MFSLKYRDEIAEPVARELEAFMIELKGYLLSEHNEDGSHRGSTIISASDPVNADPDPTSETGIAPDASRWWRAPGPWLFDDRNATNPDVVGIRPNLSSGTYNDYAPTGINDAVILEIQPEGGDVTLNGLRQHLGIARNKRMLLLRNRSDSNSIFLIHESGSSSTGSRFNLPGGTDIELGPGQNAWLYYDPAHDAWTAAITPQASGGIGAGGAWTSIFKTADETRLNTTTFADDSDLLFTVSANSKYAFRGNCLVRADGLDGNGDFKMRFTTGATVTNVGIIHSVFAHNPTQTAGTTVETSNSQLPTAAININSGNDNSIGGVWFTGILQVGASGGTFSIQWAQSVLDAGDEATMLAGSWLEYRLVS